MTNQSEAQAASTPGESRYPTRTLTGYLSIMARGYAMGAADVVPGVSGGTMAFILGIYEELIDSIKDITSREFIEAALKLRIKQLFEIVNWRFLLAVALGILLAIFSLAHALEWLLIHQPVLVWSFFFGLIVASVFIVSQRIAKWSAPRIIAVAVGAVATYLVVGLIPAQTPSTWWYFLLSGSLAICAMILPGVSGAFILVLLGKYQDVLGAVTDRDFLTLFLVAAGAGIGLITIARLLSWLFKRYHDGTVATLIGLMIGSLRKVWPWKVVEEYILDSHGEHLPTVERNILPDLMIDGAFNYEILIAAGLASAAVALIVLLERLASAGGKDAMHLDAEAAAS